MSDNNFRNKKVDYIVIFLKSNGEIVGSKPKVKCLFFIIILYGLLQCEFVCLMCFMDIIYLDDIYIVLSNKMIAKSQFIKAFSHVSSLC